ncbi:hypothetical protein L596_013484 [Steinernema carpocapsae]|nr:hypothetical protein L596_013484 [Steinernema carpocapsae]
MPGILSLSNMTPCNGHVWTYYFAKQHIVFWFAYTATSEVLALNRMMIFASKHMSQILYDGNRSWLWITAIIAYTAGMFSIDPAAQFVYDPDFGAIFDATTNLVHVANNFSKLGIVSVLYILMLVFMFKQTRTAGKKVDKGQIKISLVTLTIAALADFASAAYVGASYLPKDTTLGKNSGIIGETCWFMLHSGTAFICMFCNNAVLEELKKLLGVQKKPKKSDATITAITVLAAMKSTHSNSRNSQDSNQSITRVNNFVK